MKCAIIGTYLPRYCGIGTFTHDLVTNMLPKGTPEEEQPFVVAINDPGESYDYPQTVKHIIHEKHFRDYPEAAEFINNNADICMLQHEFNLYGGEDGVYILSLLNKLTIPLVTVLHTIKKNPSVSEHYIIREIFNLSARLVVLSRVASDILHETYNIPKNRISMIRHGVPDIRLDHNKTREKLNLGQNKVLLTFGLLTRNKGVETVLKALPAVVEKYPEVRYIIAGKTHPVNKRISGEEYRNYLEKLTQDLKLGDNVRFENRFIDDEELNQLLAATDILITPYLSEAQVTSGPLSFAMGAGAAVISTPFWHARELLADNRGRLYEFRDYRELSEHLLDLFDHPQLLNTIRKNSASFGSKIIWPVIGRDFYALVESVLVKSKKAGTDSGSAGHIKYPTISFRHIRKLTDSTGIISYAFYGIPNLKNGYRLEDNARALMAATTAYRLTGKKNLKSLMTTYLSFIQFMQNSDGSFNQHLNYDRVADKDEESENWSGSAFRALGYLIANPPDYSFTEVAKHVFNRAVTKMSNPTNIRDMAYGTLGICHYLKAVPHDQMASELLYMLMGKLKSAYRDNGKENWNWFEPAIKYDNAVIPLALMYVSEITQEEESRAIAFESMRFLTDIVMKDGRLSLVGNRQWYKKGGERSVFDQLPLDAMGMVLLYKKAFEITHNLRFYRFMRICFNWFFGDNDLRVTLYDSNTRGCYDGLQETGVNRNQGAESTLSFVISHLAISEVEQYLEMENFKDVNKFGRVNQDPA